MGKGAMPKTGQTAIAANLREVRAKIATAAREAGRDAQAVTLVAVSKTHPAAAVEAAVAAWQTVVGENRVQEARGKFPSLNAAHPTLRPPPLRRLSPPTVTHALAQSCVSPSAVQPPAPTAAE